jgi:Xaa-Pro dipeptidase
MPMTLLVPVDELDRRLAVFQRVLVETQIDLAIIVESTDLYYLAGTVTDGHLLVPACGPPALLVRRDYQRARDASALADVTVLRSLRDLPDAVTTRYDPPTRIGFEFDVLPVAAYLRYQRLFADAALVDCMPALRRARNQKSTWELDRIRAAAAQVGIAQQAAPGLLRPGISDRDLQVDLEHVLRQAGHQGPCRFRGMNGEMFFGAVLAGTDAAVAAAADTPLGGPGPSPAIGRGPAGFPITPGVAVTVDLVGAVDGYLADTTRTIWLGQLDATLRRALDTCELILREAAGLLTAGRPWQEPYTRSVAIAADAGFQDGFMGSVSFIGHGVGLEINEPPFLAGGFTEPLAAGNVIAVEPKIIVGGVGAVGVENTYVVRESGPPENLTDFA